MSRSILNQLCLFKLSLVRSIPPLSWVRCVHPEGAVYFWDSGRVRSLAFDFTSNSRALSQRIVTDADILNDAVCGLVENRLKMIQDYIVKYDIVPARLMHVHLYLEHYPKTSSFGYYFVDHIKQTLFWLDTKYGHPIVKELQTPSPSLRHVGDYHTLNATGFGLMLKFRI